MESFRSQALFSFFIFCICAIMNISIKKRGNNMGTSTESYRRKKKLRNSQKERNEKTMEKLEGIRKKQSKN